jgi:hypothetical protein
LPGAAGTQQALAADPAPSVKFASTRQWVFHYYYNAADGVGGEIDCVRSVPVQFDSDDKEQRGQHEVSTTERGDR